MVRNKKDKGTDNKEDKPSETVFTLLLHIENRLTTIESSMKWFKGVSRLGVVVLFGFLGFNVEGMI